LPDLLHLRLALADPCWRGARGARALAGSRPSWRR